MAGASSSAPGSRLDQSVLATYLHPGDAATPVAQRVLSAAASVRVRGSGTLELAWLAAGRLDAWVQRDVLPWDWLPGALVVQEAGGRCGHHRSGANTWSYSSTSAAFGDLTDAIGH